MSNANRSIWHCAANNEHCPPQFRIKGETKSQIFRFNSPIERMNTFSANNECGKLPMSGDFRNICFHFTAEALQWLSGTTSDDRNRPVANRSLFYDLLRRMRFTAGREEAFRRPQWVPAGAFQFSEIGLAVEWNMGRKRVHNLLLTMERIGLIAVHSSRVASIAAMVCIDGWTDKRGNCITNPYSRFDKHC